MIHAKLDHQYLNEVEGLGKATSEHLAVWIFEKLKGSLVRETAEIRSIHVSETPYSGAEYGGPE